MEVVPTKRPPRPPPLQDAITLGAATRARKPRRELGVCVVTRTAAHAEMADAGGPLTQDRKGRPKLAAAAWMGLTIAEDKANAVGKPTSAEIRARVRKRPRSPLEPPQKRSALTRTGRPLTGRETATRVVPTALILVGSLVGTPARSGAATPEEIRVRRSTDRPKPLRVRKEGKAPTFVTEGTAEPGHALQPLPGRKGAA